MCAMRSRVVSPLIIFPAGCCVFVLRPRSFTHCGCDTPGCWLAVRCFEVFPTVFCRAMVFLARFSRVFDTPVESSVFNGFRGVRGCPICVAGRCAVGLSLAAAQRVVPRLGFPEVGEWWWFENSKAYLYYFFIVNDCQSVLRPACLAWVPGGRSNGTGFLRTVRFPYKRMSVSLFLRVTCWFSS